MYFFLFKKSIISVLCKKTFYIMFIKLSKDTCNSWITLKLFAWNSITTVGSTFGVTVLNRKLYHIQMWKKTKCYFLSSKKSKLLFHFSDSTVLDTNTDCIHKHPVCNQNHKISGPHFSLHTFITFYWKFKFTYLPLPLECKLQKG